MRPGARAWLCVGGMWAALVVRPDTELATIALLLGGAAMALRRARHLALVALVLMGFGFGGLTALRLNINSPLTAIAARAPHCELTGTILERTPSGGELIGLSELRCEDSWRVDKGVVFSSSRGHDAGTRVTGGGVVSPVPESSFGAHLRDLGADAIWRGEVRVIHPATGLHGVAGRFRRGLSAAVGGLDAERASLLQGLTIGETGGIDELTLERFRRSGLAHLLAVSGSNVAIVLGMVALACARTGLSARISAAAFALVLFVLVVGPDPSVLRAAAMGAISLLALLHGARARPVAVLGIALICLLAFRPSLATSPGLHLSVAATLGIVLWSEPLARRLGHFYRPARLAIAATLAAQIAVAPILIVTFGRLPVLGPLANALALPAVVPATVLGLCAGIAGMVDVAMGDLLARAAEPFVGWILAVAEFVGDIDGASPQMSDWVGWALLAVLAPPAWTAFRADSET